MSRQERRRDLKAERQVQSLLRDGVKSQQKGDLAAAQKSFREAVRRGNDHAEANCRLGGLLLDMRQAEAAIPVLAHAVKLQPVHFMTFYQLGTAYRLARQAEPAIRAYQAALALQPDFLGAVHGMGAALNLAEREGEAIAWLRRAVQQKPDFVAAWQDLGAALSVMGELAEAQAAFKRAVALDPLQGSVQRMLATLQEAKPEAGTLAALIAASEHPATPPKARIEMLFALGKLFDQAEETDRAFDFYVRANQARRAMQAGSGISYDRKKFSNEIDALIAAFDEAAISQAADSGNLSEAPVFIVGMPRSGSSLAEQIAASHALVTGAGEYIGIEQIARRLGPTPAAWTSAALAAEAQNYLDGVTAKAGAATRIVDKFLDNSLQLGLIAQLFPNARVIFCEREQADLCLSCFFQNFSGPIAFDSDLEDAAHRDVQIARLARHWQSVLKLRHMALRYEDVVADLPGQARRLIAFMGLEWDESCLAFHRATRPVRTASWAQVRQPLYKDAVGKWRRYAHRLPAEWGLLG